VRRSTRVVAQASSGDAKQRIAAPNVTSQPAARSETSSPAASSLSIPAGAKTAVPVTKFPSNNALRASGAVMNDPKE
jgi:hypothetical protein